MSKGKITTTIVILLVIGVGGVSAYYYEDIAERFAKERSEGEEENAERDPTVLSEGVEIATLRELSDTATWDAPGKSYRGEFTLFVDDENIIRGVRSLNVEDPSDQEKLNEFSETLFTDIEGRNLEELEEVDKVGSSSLTTDAFNEALEGIKADL